MPPPGSDFAALAAEAEQFGDTISVDDIPLDSSSGSRSEPGPPDAIPMAAGGPGEDEPPGHARREWRKPPRAPRGKSAPKLTAAIHGDIHGKISLMLEIPGQIWAARDPVCGGTFVQQRPAIADALTDIVCESADLVAFFTGPAGGFMRYLNLGVALMPVGQAVMAHHVYHTVEAGEQAQPAETYQQYAA